MTTQNVSDEKFARLFLGDNPGITGTALELEDKVRQYLEAHGLTQRSPLLIAVEAVKLAPPVQTAEQAAFEANVSQGFGDQIPDVREMNWDQYAAYRRQANIGNPDLVSFLSGGR